MRTIKITCIALAATLLLCACNKKPEETEEVYETEPSAEEPLDLIPLTEDILDGNWLNETGFICGFDTDRGIFTDPYGSEYYILEINDDSIVISLKQSDSIDYYYLTMLDLPFGTTLEISAKYDGSALHILNTYAYNGSSDEGAAFSQDIFDRLSGQTLDLQMNATLTFNDDITEIEVSALNTSHTKVVEYDDGTLIFYDDEPGRLAIRLYGEELALGLNGTIGFCTDSSLDMNGGWLHYQSSDGTTEVYEQTDKSDFDITLMTSPFSPLLETDDGTYLACQGLSGVYVDQDLFAQYPADLNSDPSAPSLFIDMNSPFAEQLLTRNEIVNSNPGSVTEHRIVFAEGFIAMDLNDNEWIYDSANIFTYDRPDAFYGLSETYTITPYSDCYYVSIDEADSAFLAFEWEGDAEAEPAVNYTDPYSGEIETLDTVIEDGLATADTIGSGLYFLGVVEREQ